jgi:hypothetical protein
MRRPPAELTRFLSPYGPRVTRLFLAARAAVLRAAPGASELVYDAYSAVATAYGYSDRLSDAFCHVAAYEEHVNLGFNRGVDLPDPERLLAGRGARIRHVRIGAPADLARGGVRALVRAAAAEGRRRVGGARERPRAVVKRTAYTRKRRPR